MRADSYGPQNAAKLARIARFGAVEPAQAVQSGSVPDCLTIVLPLPDRRLHPNARVHWREKANVVKTARQQAHWEAKLTLQRLGIEAPGWERVEVQYKAVFPVKRNHDQDGIIAQMKSAMDGICDSGVILNDVGVTLLPVTIEVGKPGRIEVQIRKLEG